jgi:hypothetical protein
VWILRLTITERFVAGIYADRREAAGHPAA